MDPPPLLLPPLHPPQSPALLLPKADNPPPRAWHKACVYKTFIFSLLFLPSVTPGLLDGGGHWPPLLLPELLSVEGPCSHRARCKGRCNDRAKASTGPRGASSPLVFTCPEPSRPPRTEADPTPIPGPGRPVGAGDVPLLGRTRVTRQRAGIRNPVLGECDIEPHSSHTSRMRKEASEMASRFFLVQVADMCEDTGGRAHVRGR